MIGENKKIINAECIFFDNKSEGDAKKLSFKVAITGNDRLRDVILNLMKNVKELSECEDCNDCPIIFKLYKKNIKYGSDFGIQYGLNSDESLRLLQWHESTRYNWTYDEVIKLKKLGIINGDLRYIVIEFPEGLGAAGGSGVEWSFMDFLNFLETIIGLLEIGLTTVNLIKTKKSVKNVRKNGFIEAKDIRKVLEKKNRWSLSTVRRMFKFDDFTAMVILMGLGFVNVGAYWVYDDNNPGALKVRAKWIEEEDKITNEILQKDDNV